MTEDMRDEIAQIVLIEMGHPWNSSDAQYTADEIITALPDMVVPLVWAMSRINGWNDDYHTLPTGYTIRCADENGWKLSFTGGFSYHYTADEAKAAAQAHHVAHIMAAFGVAETHKS